MTTIDVCIGSACHLKGSYGVINALQAAIEANGAGDAVELNAVFCLGHCTDAVSVQLNHGDIYSLNPETATAFFQVTVKTLIGR